MIGGRSGKSTSPQRVGFLLAFSSPIPPSNDVLISSPSTAFTPVDNNTVSKPKRRKVADLFPVVTQRAVAQYVNPQSTRFLYIHMSNKSLLSQNLGPRHPLASRGHPLRGHQNKVVKASAKGITDSIPYVTHALCIDVSGTVLYICSAFHQNGAAHGDEHISNKASSDTAFVAHGIPVTTIHPTDLIVENNALKFYLYRNHLVPIDGAGYESQYELVHYCFVQSSVDGVVDLDRGSAIRFNQGFTQESPRLYYLNFIAFV